MGVLQRTCVLYVDYTDLVLSLSRVPYFDFVAVLNALQEKARQQFYIQEVHIYHHWMLETLRQQLEEEHLACQHVQEAASSIEEAIRADLERSLASPMVADTYILVSGSNHYPELLTTIQQTHRQALLWTYNAPSKQQNIPRVWQRIALPTPPARPHWIRSIMLQAIALTTDDRLVDAYTPLAVSKLQTQLMRNSAFRSATDTWITIAISEHILLPARPARVRSPRGYILLNHEHRLVQHALELREHIMITLSTLLVNREWVAFNVLERALSTHKQLADDQRTRQSWIEVLIEEKVLIALRVPHPDGQHEVTTLRLNRDHPQALFLQRYQQRNLQRLILGSSLFLERRRTDWQAISQLLRDLTEQVPHIEARATMDAAERQKVIVVDSIPNPRNPLHPVSVAYLNYNHRLVQATLDMRNTLIHESAQLLAQLPRGTVSASTLEERLSASQEITRDEAHFWLSVFLHFEILLAQQSALHADRAASMLYLNELDPVVADLRKAEHV